MDTRTFMHWVSAAFEGVGVLIIVGGFLVALVRTLLAPAGTERYTVMRGTFGRGVLLGLEVLVAADLIRTVIVTPTLDGVLVLGLLVLIRTFLSWSFEIELDGMFPWRRHAEQQGGTATARDG
jgi:uncharacterized membrane protein